MRTNILRSVAITLGICVCGTVQAQYGGYGSTPVYPANQYPAANFGAPVNGQQTHANTGQAYAAAQPQAPAYAGPRNAPQQYQGAQFQAGQATGNQYQAGNFQPGGFAGQAPSAVPVHPSLQRTPAANQWSPGGPQGPGFPQSPYRSVSDAGMNSISGAPMGSGHLPPPPMHQPIPAGGSYGMSAHSQHTYAADGSCTSCNANSVYMDAAAAPWDAGPIGATCGTGLGCAPSVPIRNWFAGASLLFLDYEEDYNRRLVFPDAMPADTMLQTNQVDPGAALGFETYFGRYFACGKYALVGTYFFFNPDREEAMITAPNAGDYRAAMPLWDRMVIDRDGDGINDNLGDPALATDDHIYGAFDSAAQYRIRRNIDIQGLELNFVSFGIGGASRAGFAGNCGTGGCGPSDPCNPCFQSGCGGMGGPMVPACHSRMQFQVSHGIRWFQFRDAFEFAASIGADGFAGDANDYFYNVDVQNDLLGYQFGTRADYMLTCRVNIYAGAKFGIYGNNVDYNSRIGTRAVAAEVGPFYPTMTGQAINVSRNETVLSTLGELDLGVGVRLTNCWTVTGGYRLLGLTGIATSVGSIAEDPAHIQAGHLNWVNDSFLLQGGYVGLNYNW